ncbi:ABC transporter permease [Octadecabacter sp. B2R22]|uniref:ABC transporter permease n=1 Tax=Octadecabacter sp. B2R22 TaxID=2841570 RepID=UPI001C0A2575|nr:ABC transporter permease [Octadecabacter sp. B2R22]MBU2994084.1 ABC transporter permease [Octadecabacter sp. B2R22]
MPTAPSRAPLPPTQTRRRFGSIRAVLALIMREMATSYGRSPGGYIWAVLEPVAAITVMSIVFSALVRSPALGISFPMFYATGMLPFLLYNAVQGKVAGALTYSRPFMAYPTVTYFDSLVARFTLETMTKLLVGYIVLTGIPLLFETRTHLNFAIIIQAYALAAALAFAVGSVNCFMFTQFPVYQRFWAVLNAPLFILSGVFFTYEIVPTEYQPLLWYNPLIHVTGLMRSGFYSTYDPDWISIPYVIGVSLTLTVFGLLLLRRYHRDLLNL